MDWSVESALWVEKDFLARGDLPAWWKAARERAWGEFQSLPKPTGKQELWRFTDTKKLDLSGYRLGVRVTEREKQECLKYLDQLRGKRKASGRFVFVNDQLIEASWHREDKEGLVCMPILEAVKRCEDWLESALHRQGGALGGEKYLALHRAHSTSGVVLRVPRRVIVSEPIEVHYFLTRDDAACFPHLCILADEGAEAEVIEYCHTLRRDCGGLCVGVSDVTLRAGARLKLIRVQNLGEKARSFYINCNEVERDASLKSLILNLGSAYARTESKSRLLGSGARSDMLSLSVPHGQQEFDQRTYQDHVAPHTSSDLLYKNALCDDARTIFSGMIRVEPSAQHTDAYQSNRNLLLSDRAEANSLPGLEIEANEVRCTHGATTGQIDQEQLFYMLSRGLRAREAKKLLIFGFFKDVLDRMEDVELAGVLTTLIDKKLVNDI